MPTKTIQQHLSRTAFSLVELLLVMSIITVLFSLSLPALRNMRETSRSAVCISNLRQIGVGLINYSMDSNGYFPCGQTNDPFVEVDNDQIYAWPYFIWNYSGLGDPNVTFIENVSDTRIRMSRPNIFVCPKTRLDKVYYPTAAGKKGNHCYGLNVNPQRFKYQNDGTLADHPAQFPFNKSWVGNAASAALVIESGFLSNIPTTYFSKTGFIPHSNGMNILYFDGHVAWMSQADIPHNVNSMFWKAY